MVLLVSIIFWCLGRGLYYLWGSIPNVKCKRNRKGDFYTISLSTFIITSLILYILSIIFLSDLLFLDMEKDFYIYYLLAFLIISLIFEIPIVTYTKLTSNHLFFFSFRNGLKKIPLEKVKEYIKIIKPFYIGRGLLYIYLGNTHIILQPGVSLGGYEFVNILFQTLDIEVYPQKNGLKKRKLMLKIESEERKKVKIVKIGTEIKL